MLGNPTEYLDFSALPEDVKAEGWVSVIGPLHSCKTPEYVDPSISLAPSAGSRWHCDICKALWRVTGTQVSIFSNGSPNKESYMWGRADRVLERNCNCGEQCQ